MAAELLLNNIFLVKTGQWIVVFMKMIVKIATAPEQNKQNRKENKWN